MEKDFFLLDLFFLLDWLNDIEFNHIEHHDRTLKIVIYLNIKIFNHLKFYSIAQK